MQVSSSTAARSSSSAGGSTGAGPPFFGIEWNAENQLRRVTKDGSEVARFAYDPLGGRVEKIAGGITTSYTYDGADILREQTSAGSVLKYVHGPGIDEPLATENAAAVLSFLHADDLGSIIKITNSAGAVTLSRSYDAFGVPQAGSTSGGYAYTGREWDPEIGLYYYRARYYDPKIGRFISEDPIGLRAGPNTYAYVAGNPLSYVDPFGFAAGACAHSADIAYNICLSERRPEVSCRMLRDAILDQCHSNIDNATKVAKCLGSGGLTPPSVVSILKCLCKQEADETLKRAFPSASPTPTPTPNPAPTPGTCTAGEGDPEKCWQEWMKRNVPPPPI